MSRRATGGQRWMAIPTARASARWDRTRLTGRLADTPTTGPGSRRAAGSVLVGTEDVWRDAGVADRRRGLQVAQGDRDLPVGEQALHVVDAISPGLDIDQAPERAALDPMRRQVIGVWLRRDHRERKGHRGWFDLACVVERGFRSTLAPETSTAIRATARRR